MSASGVIGGWLVPVFLGLNPVERMNAARGRFSGSGSGTSSAWIWIVLGVLILAVVAAGVAFSILRRNKPKRPVQPTQGPSPFDRYADQADLNEEEGRLLRSIAETARLKRLESVFMLEAAFERGLAKFLESDDLAAAPEETRKDTLAHIESLRHKLGFHGAVDSEQTKPASSRQVPVGSGISIVDRRGAGFGATVTANTDEGIEIEPEMPIQCKAGDSWLVRCPVEAKVWQFDTRVLKSREGRIVLAHTKRVRFRNRRRYPRIPVQRSAYVAEFPFVKSGSQARPPKLLKASLIELAGPGLKLQAPISVELEDNVLIALKLSGEKVVQGMGKVRQVFGDDQGRSVFAVELIGLRDSEVAELARETAESARDNSADETAAQTEQPAAALQEG